MEENGLAATPKRQTRPPLPPPPPPPPPDSPVQSVAASPSWHQDPSEHEGAAIRLKQHKKKRKRRDPQRSLGSVVQQVSRKAALSTKKAVWDSNEISVDAAIRAVDQWEALYGFFRQFTILSLQQAHNVYQATKTGAAQMEQGILRPVRDWIVLPAFGGMERAVLFLQSDQANHVAQQSLEVVRLVPILGEHVLCPGLCLTGNAVQQMWHIVQYPIPSKEQVRDSVDWALSSSKGALLAACREIFLYMKRADASITRVLSHSQWKVLGSGPYATLDEGTKREVLSRVAERYCRLHPLWRGFGDSEQSPTTSTSTTNAWNHQLDHDSILARYELAAHIKRHNPPLYEDLIRSGFLMDKGGVLFRDDEWLMPCPVYRHLDNNFLIPDKADNDDDIDEDTDCRLVKPLWFRLPNVNGKPPARDSPWICFTESDQHELEARYLQLVHQSPERTDDDAGNGEEKTNEYQTRDSKKHPTIAQWYVPDHTTDVMVDQKRHAVSLRFHSSNKKSDDTRPALDDNAVEKAPFLVPPPLSSVMRPTFWRFHGQGDRVRRSGWFLDAPRNGLQPFDDEAQALLEDAYCFLKWMSMRKSRLSFKKDVEKEEKGGDDDGTDDALGGALLTIDVTCPDGVDRLVQFGSLTQATAIQKGLSAAFSINKMRVYRGAWLPKRRNQDEEGQLLVQPKPVEVSLQESILRASVEHGTLGDTGMPDVCLRSILKPPPQPPQFDQLAGFSDSLSTNTLREDDLAVPTSRLFEDDMVKSFKDPSGGPIDHVCLIVHGIGEMLQSIDLFGLALPNLSTIVDCCGYLRQNHTEVQMTDFSQMYPTEGSNNGRMGRVEYLPVEWHEAFSILSQRRAASAAGTQADNSPENNVMMKDISLPTIPNMREFANDTLMDVLYFMSPEHHDIIIDIVANEMNVVVDKFRQFTGFSGRVSIVGHSLGSIISWDILANQTVSLNQSPDGDLAETRAIASNGSFDSLLEYHECSPELDVPPPTKQPFVYPQLRFQVENFFLLGSPVAVFLMIRNQRKPLHDTYSLSGCRRVWNIFHPYDPVAYRIEPCIDPGNGLIEPTIIKHWNGGFRVQYQTKRLWRQLLDTTRETQQNVVEALEASMAGMGLLDSAARTDDNDDDSWVSELDGDSFENSYVAGQLNRGRRIDYMLQEKEIENANEYVAALAAHSCYWTEKDLSLFIAQQISFRTGDQTTAV